MGPRPLANPAASAGEHRSRCSGAGDSVDRWKTPSVDQSIGVISRRTPGSDSDNPHLDPAVLASACTRHHGSTTAHSKRLERGISSQGVSPPLPPSASPLIGSLLTLMYHYKLIGTSYHWHTLDGRRERSSRPIASDGASGKESGRFPRF